VTYREPSPSPLDVSTPTKLLMLGGAATMTVLSFGLLPAFDAIGRRSQPSLATVSARMITAPPKNAVRPEHRPAPRRRPKPKLTIEPKLRNLTPSVPNTSLAAALGAPVMTLHQVLGAVALDFRVAEPAAPPSKPPEPVTFTVRDLDAPPRLLTVSKPRYPFRARQRGIEGHVDIEFTIEADGSVGTVTVTGAEPRGVFEDSACEAARRWRFSTPQREGTAVRVLARQRIEFRLGSS